MANLKSGNSWYVDSTSPDFDGKNVIVTAIVVTGTHTSNAGSITVKDPTTSATRLSLMANPRTTTVLDLSASPLLFPNGINISAISDAVATFIGRVAGA